MIEQKTFIDWEVVGRPAQEINHELEQEFMNNLNQLKTTIRSIEDQATRVMVPDDKQNRVNLIAVHIGNNFSDELAATQTRTRILVEPLLGMQVRVSALSICHQTAKGFYEYMNEVSLSTVEGHMHGIHSFIADFEASYHKGFAPPGVTLPAIGQFQRFRLGVNLGDVSIPLENIQKLEIIDN